MAPVGPTKSIQAVQVRALYSKSSREEALGWDGILSEGCVSFGGAFQEWHQERWRNGELIHFLSESFFAFQFCELQMDLCRLVWSLENR